jgi:two-component system sensor histidine kinase PilS (NtrC family)
VRRAGEAVELRVWDSAGAIRAEDMPRLFEPFFSRKEGGTGLGLSTVQSIVHSHQGTIDVESAPGKGTTFTVRLPTGNGV